MKVILILFLLMMLLFHPAFFSECRADHDGDLFAFVIGAGLGAVAINGGFIASNVVNVTRPKPMGFGGKFLTGTGMAFGLASTVTSSLLIAETFDSASAQALYTGLAFVGAGTMGTGIWSFVVDHQQRKNPTAFNIMPFACDKNKTVPGLTIFGAF